MQRQDKGKLKKGIDLARVARVCLLSVVLKIYTSHGEKTSEIEDRLEEEQAAFRPDKQIQEKS